MSFGSVGELVSDEKEVHEGSLDDVIARIRQMYQEARGGIPRGDDEELRRFCVTQAAQAEPVSLAATEFLEEVEKDASESEEIRDIARKALGA
jgi:hypothetical protein